MQKLIEIILVCGGLYVAYALSVKNWSYDSHAVRKEQRTRFKELGMSNVYYFTPAKKLFILTVLSGGFFAFYWLYKQWEAVLSGFQCLSRAPLKGGAAIRTIFFFISIYPLGNIINRTCVYMRKKPNLPAWFLGTGWGLSFVGMLILSSPWGKLTAYLLFCSVPLLMQRRLNALLAVDLPNTGPKRFEIIFVAASWVFLLGITTALRVLFY